MSAVAHTDIGSAPSRAALPAVKKAYVPPRLERFGTIREVTLGRGKNNVADGAHPPGQNRSRF